MLSLAHTHHLVLFIRLREWNALFLRLVLIEAFHPKDSSSNLFGFACTSLIFIFPSYFFSFFLFQQQNYKFNRCNLEVTKQPVSACTLFLSVSLKSVV